jgi:hypothetical protein
MDFVITPFEQVGPIQFGMVPEQVHQALQYSPESRSIDNEINDFFEDLGISVDYSQINGQWSCIAVALYYPSNPIFQGRSLFEQNIEEEEEYLASDIEEWLLSFDNNVEVERSEGYVVFNGLGIMLYEQPYSPASVTVYARSWFSDSR